MVKEHTFCLAHVGGDALKRYPSVSAAWISGSGPRSCLPQVIMFLLQPSLQVIE